MSIGAILLLLHALLGAPSVTRAQEVGNASGVPSVHEWNIYAGPEIAIFGHSAKGGSHTSQLTGPRVGNPSSTLGDQGTEIWRPLRLRQNVMSFLVGGTFGALTPGLDMPLRPRFFLEFNVSDPKTTEAQLAREGIPGAISFPALNPPSPTSLGEGVILGTGTRITAQQQKPQIHAGFGGSIEFPIPGDQLIRIKPGLMYSRIPIDLRAQTRRAVRLNNDRGAAQGIDDFRFVLLDDRVKKVYHAIGPSLEIEYFPGAAWGPLAFSLYARGHGMYTLNSVRTQMQRCNTAGGQPNECAFYQYDQNHWAGRATIGFRLTWLPGRSW